MEVRCLMSAFGKEGQNSLIQGWHHASFEIFIEPSPVCLVSFSYCGCVFWWQTKSDCVNANNMESNPRVGGKSKAWCPNRTAITSSTPSATSTSCEVWEWMRLVDTMTNGMLKRNDYFVHDPTPDLSMFLSIKGYWFDEILWKKWNLKKMALAKLCTPLIQRCSLDWPMVHSHGSTIAKHLLLLGQKIFLKGLFFKKGAKTCEWSWTNA